MTDPDVADKTYIEPITLGVLEKIIKKENQDLFTRKASASIKRIKNQTAELNKQLSN